jgi:hypothetical protein
MENDIVYKSLLYDFYGELLTNKQKNIVDMYYNHDLTLSEISENIDISRQGVYDALKRAENTLEGYEVKLKLVERFIKQNCLLKKANSKLDQILCSEFSNVEELRYKLNDIKSIIKQLI